jgi:hypothetical protein
MTGHSKSDPHKLGRQDSLCYDCVGLIVNFLHWPDLQWLEPCVKPGRTSHISANHNNIIQPHASGFHDFPLTIPAKD